jgi:outer membrane receptor protein involved in Fe transport
MVQVLYIGYRAETRQITVSGDETAQASFELAVNVLAMEELVVTGTGVVTERKRLGQTIATVGAQQLEEVVAGNVTEVLQGRIPGLVAHTATGEAGSSSPIRLRGTVSLSQRNEPIIYIDGVRIDNSSTSVASVTSNALNDINPSDIERIEVIKGAAAATLFGTEASAGVIQIFTKRGGSSGPPRYTVEIEQGFSQLPEGRIPQNYAYDRDASRQVLSNRPASAFIRAGQSFNVAASVQGGAGNTQYVFSGRYRDESGTLPNNGLGNWSARLGLDHGLTEKLQARFDVNLIHSTLDAPYPTWGLLGEAVLADPSKVSEQRPHGELFYTIGGALAYDSRLTSDARTMSGRLGYRWSPRISSELIVGYNSVNQERVLGIDKGASPFNDMTGLRNLFDSYRSALTIDGKTSWQTDFGPSVNSTFVVGGQSFWENRRSKTVGVRDFAAPGLETLSGGATVYSISETQAEVINAGLFAQEQLGLWDRLFLTVGARMDGNSAFGKDFGFQFYPKAGASWVVSDHAFWNLADIGWDQLRLRAALGTAGLQPGAFDAQRTWRPATMVSNQPVVRPLNQGNPQLKPERSVERELAAELGFFEGRLGVEIVYFNQKTSDALLAKPSAPSLGFLNPQLTNIGELTSKGVEVSANWAVMRRSNFDWSMNATIATLNQIVTDMGGVPTFRISGTQRRYNSVAVGYQPGAVMAPIVNPDDPYRLSVPVEDFTSLAQLTPNFLRNNAGGDSIVFIGNQAPTLTGSFATKFSLPSNLHLQILFNGAAGFVMMNETELIRAASGITGDVAEMQQKLDDPSTTTAERQQIADRYGRKDPRVISHWAESGDYMRLQEVSLGYQMPERFARMVGAARMSLALAGRNLLLFTKYTGMQDPGSSTSTTTFISKIDYFKAPQPRSLTLQVRANW